MLEVYVYGKGRIGSKKEDLFFFSDWEVAECESHLPVLVSSMVLHG